MRKRTNSEHVIFSITGVVFEKEDSSFRVLTALDENGEECTLIGGLEYIYVPMKIQAKGKWVESETYGRQFRVLEWDEILPTKLSEIEEYLKSSITGIGSFFAKFITRRFKDKTFQVIEETPDELMKIWGIGLAKRDWIVKSWWELKGVRRIKLFLRDYNITNEVAHKIFSKWKHESIQTIKKNPYILSDEIEGIGFKIADSIALGLGFDNNSISRITSGIIHTLKEYSQSYGHVFLTQEQLTSVVCKSLSVDSSLVGNAIHKAEEDGKIHLEEGKIYYTPLYETEEECCRHLARIAGTPVPVGQAMKVNVDDIIKKIGIDFNNEQRTAVEEAIISKILIITGGPGTGKTTVMRAVLEAFKSIGHHVFLAAPTGRAAKRLEQSAKRFSVTIHGLLRARSLTDFFYDEKNKLDGEVVIIDEASMVDIYLLKRLLRAIPDHMQVIFVGDVDQLPSVGPGNVLQDLIESDLFSVCRLNQVYRQGEGSNIISSAFDINHGLMPDLSNRNSKDFFFMEESDPEKIQQTILDLINTRLPNKYGYTVKDIQVLTPMHKGPIGTYALNDAIQKIVNPNRVLHFGGVDFRVGDRVISIYNSEEGPCNGDIGYIDEVNPEEKSIHAKFELRGSLTMEDMDLHLLELAYAITIHKSQGGEFPVVIIPMHDSHYVMLQRKLLYTAVTRAKKMCIVIGQKEAVRRAVNNIYSTIRNTTLKEKLNSYISIH